MLQRGKYRYYLGLTEIPKIGRRSQRKGLSGWPEDGTVVSISRVALGDLDWKATERKALAKFCRKEVY